MKTYILMNSLIVASQALWKCEHSKEKKDSLLYCISFYVCMYAEAL